MIEWATRMLELLAIVSASAGMILILLMMYAVVKKQLPKKQSKTTVDKSLFTMAEQRDY